jgi:hypothetical protein
MLRVGEGSVRVVETVRRGPSSEAFKITLSPYKIGAVRSKALPIS